MAVGDSANGARLVAPAACDVIGDQQITSLSSATAPTIPAGTRWIVAQAETQNVRWRAGASAPTASVGMILYAGDQPTLIPINQAAMALLKFIEATASAKLNLVYLG